LISEEESVQSVVETPVKKAWKAKTK
jgi:hypothetical protein